MMWKNMQIEVDNSRILHIIQKPNLIIVLLLIKNITK